MTKFLTPALLAIATMTLSAPQLASAGHDSPLYEAACNYREAAKDFERVVDRSRYVSRVQRDLADDLEDASSDLRSAARRPERRTELVTTWQQVQFIQSQVETVIFGNPNCPSRVDLLPCWQEVLCAAAAFEEQLALLPACGVGAFQPAYRTPIHTLPTHHYRPRVQEVHPSWHRSHHLYRAPSWNTPSWNSPSWNTPRSSTPSWNSFPSNGRYRLPASSLHLHDDVRIERHSISPSERQIQQTERHLQRAPSYRQWDSATLGALISRLID